MVNRIREILKRYDINSSRLADELDVPRSTISHILSERNKPSLEFIQKVLDRFPEIDTDWLLKGKGSIHGKEKDLFSELENPVIPKSILVDTKPDELPAEDEINPPATRAEAKDLNLTKEYSPSDMSNEAVKQEITAKKNDLKKIVRIITFYEDNTFMEYFPSNKEN